MYFFSSPSVLFLKVYKIRIVSLIFVPLKVHFYLTTYKPALEILKKNHSPISRGEFIHLIQSDNPGFINNIEIVLKKINIESEQDELAKVFQILGEKKGINIGVSSLMYDAMMLARYSNETTPSCETMNLNKLFNNYNKLLGKADLSHYRN